MESGSLLGLILVFFGHCVVLQGKFARIHPLLDSEGAFALVSFYASCENGSSEAFSAHVSGSPDDHASI